MIEVSEILPLLVEASPTFSKEWAVFQAEWANERSLPYYIALGLFASHMCSLFSEGQHQTLVKVFAVIERLLTEGNSYVKESTIVGLLEDLQNVILNHPTMELELFERFLLPKTMHYWCKVIAFWSEGEVISIE